MVLTGGREEAMAGAGNLPSGTLSPHTYLTPAGHRSRTKERKPQIPDPLGHAVLERQTDNSTQVRSPELSATEGAGAQETWSVARNAPITMVCKHK